MRKEARETIAAASVFTILMGTFGVADYMRNETNAEQPAGTPIDLGVLPDQVPAAVVNRIPDAATVHATSLYKDSKGKPIWESTYGSADEISPGMYVTAGHVIDNKQDQPLEGLSFCDNLFVDQQVASPVGSFAASSIDAILKSGTYSGKSDSKIPDIAVLITDGRADQSLPTDILPLATAVPGEPLVAVNFEPTASGKVRDPDISNGHPSKADLPYTKPAIYGGVVLAKLANGTLLVAEGVDKSYGTVPDNHSRAGASGGAEYNEAGELVGVTVAGVTSPVSKQDLINDYHVAVKNAPKEVYLTYVQPVTRQLLTQLLPRQGEYLPECNPGPIPNINQLAAPKG